MYWFLRFPTDPAFVPKSVSTWMLVPRVVSGDTSALWEVLTELMEWDCGRSHVGQGSKGRDQLAFTAPIIESAHFPISGVWNVGHSDLLVMVMCWKARPLALVACCPLWIINIDVVFLAMGLYEARFTPVTTASPNYASRQGTLRCKLHQKNAAWHVTKYVQSPPSGRWFETNPTPADTGDSFQNFEMNVSSRKTY